MTWILIDLAIALLALGLLAVLVLRLWKRVKALSKAVTAAGDAVTQASDALAAAQGEGPLGATPRPGGVHSAVAARGRSTA